MAEAAPDESKPCTCRFCGERFRPSGIKNHETWCDSNPHAGVHPDIAPSLFDERSAAAQESVAGSDRDPDPDQSDQSASLPDREVLSNGSKSPANRRNARDPAEPGEKCRYCSSRETVPAEVARREYVERTAEPLQPVLDLFNAGARYCNACFAVFGGSLDHAIHVAEVVDR